MVVKSRDEYIAETSVDYFYVLANIDFGKRFWALLDWNIFIYITIIRMRTSKKFENYLVFLSLHSSSRTILNS